MSFITIIQILVDVLTITTGVYALFAPLKITEIRAVMGGVFIALGVAALYFHSSSTNMMLGVVYLVIGFIRTISMFVDKSLVPSNFISLAVEIVFGIMMLI
jgi:hypothetical protein